MSCHRCPHCIASGALGLIDEDDPALAGAVSPEDIRRDIADLVKQGLVKKRRGLYSLTKKGALETSDPAPASKIAPSMVHVTCAWKPCSAPRVVKRADRARGWGRYCSKSCKAKAQARDRERSSEPHPSDWTEGGERDVA